MAAVALLTCAYCASSAQAGRGHGRGEAARHAAIRARRCRVEHPRRGCGESARVRRQKHHHEASRKRALRETEEAPPQALPAALSSGPAPGANGEPCSNTELVPSGSNLAQVRESTLCLINEQREQHGEVPLRENGRLNSAAQGHSEDMVTRDYFEHTSPTGEEFQTRIMASGYVPSGAEYELGENIDTATLSLTTPAATVTAWMNSPDHRANILNGEFRETGIGVAAAAPAYFSEGEAGATYTQDFGVLAS
jgi:uncharacterized protein YkwD